MHHEEPLSTHLVIGNDAIMCLAEKVYLMDENRRESVYIYGTGKQNDKFHYFYVVYRSDLYYNINVDDAVAQLEERYPDTVEVIGSSPVSITIFF